MTITKNTIRLVAEFHNFSGVLADPQQVTLAISNSVTSASMLLLTGSEITHDSTGSYHYDYTVPVGRETLLYEWSGVLENSAIVNRGTISREWLRGVL